MRLFRRKQSEEDLEERCPQCSEPIPQGADECMMCGVGLRPFRGDSRYEEPSPHELDRLPGR